ncbi:hypothetical protein QBC47DRAFT_430595 [Echria macrotheca]|uniref:Uncharacterized protein n=1 Tax=Echria macrotheca TaxID=438768 RepID=A0AAJ0B8M0_9PEZI|nr:hypothetical protein QBC47DRAFT_430595 [Echria macrotheca]
MKLATTLTVFFAALDAYAAPISLSSDTHMDRGLRRANHKGVGLLLEEEEEEQVRRLLWLGLRGLPRVPPALHRPADPDPEVLPSTKKTKPNSTTSTTMTNIWILHCLTDAILWQATETGGNTSRSTRPRAILNGNLLHRHLVVPPVDELLRLPLRPREVLPEELDHPLPLQVVLPVVEHPHLRRLPGEPPADEPLPHRLEVLLVLLELPRPRRPVVSPVVPPVEELLPRQLLLPVQSELRSRQPRRVVLPVDELLLLLLLPHPEALVLDLLLPLLLEVPPVGEHHPLPRHREALVAEPSIPRQTVSTTNLDGIARGSGSRADR